MKYSVAHTCALLVLPGIFPCLGNSVAASGQDAEQQLAAHQQRARAAEQKQDFATAVREYQMMVDAVPNNAELESNLGVALYFNHELKTAADTLRRAETLKPALYAPHLFLGLAMARLGKPDAAVLELEKAVSINNADSLAHTWLGYEYTAQSHFEKAAEQMQIAAQQKPDDGDAWFALGRCYLELGKQATVELLHAAPDGGRTWQLAGEQYDAQGNSGKAVKLHSGALERRPDIPDLRGKVVARGIAVPAARARRDANEAEEDRLYQLVHIDQSKAREAFEHVANINPDSYRAHEILGDSAAASDRFDDAIPEYRMVLERKPDLPGIHGDLCNALSRTGRIQEAIKECDAEITLSPYSADAYVQDARLHVLEEENGQAAALLGKALSLDRPPIAAYKLKAKIDVAGKQYGAAIEGLTRYLAVDSKDASAWFLLARAYNAVGDSTKMAQAIETYKKTSDVARGSGEVQRALGTQRDRDAVPGEEGPRDGSPM